MPAAAPGRLRGGIRRWLLRPSLALAATALALAGAELLLALHALPLSEAPSRFVYGCYEPSQPRSFIHASIGPLKVGLHRPDFEADCYFLGYFWHHRSDAFGWRNPATWDAADVVLIGDSMIYGHGVEERQTTAHFLRGVLGRRVVNMAIAGGSPVHYLAYTRNFALPLRPAVVVVFTFGNDLKDIRATRPMAKIRRFARTGKGREARILPRSTLLRELRYPGHEPAVLDRFALYRLLDYQRRAWWRPPPATAAEHADAPPVAAPARVGPRTPPPAEVLDQMERLFTVRYLRRALAMMAESCNAAGAALVVGHIGEQTRTDWLLRRLLRETSIQHGFHYFDTPELLGRHRLPNDGHLSEAGHRRLAEALAAYLDEQGLLPGKP